MVTSTTNLLLQKQAAGELVDEQIEFSGNLDILDATKLGLEAAPTFQKQFQNFEDLNGGSGWLMPHASEVLVGSSPPPRFSTPVWESNRLYKVKAFVSAYANWLNGPGSGGRFIPRLVNQQGPARFSTRNFNLKKTNLPGVLNSPAWIAGAQPAQVTANTDVENYAPDAHQTLNGISNDTQNILRIDSTSVLGSGGLRIDWTPAAPAPASLARVFTVPIGSGADIPLAVGNQISMGVLMAGGDNSHTYTLTFEYQKADNSTISFDTISGSLTTLFAQKTLLNKTIPALCDHVVVKMVVNYAAGIPGTGFWQDIVLVKGATVPAFFYFDTANTGVTDYFVDDTNPLRTMSRTFGRSAWCFAHDQGTSSSSLTIVEGIINPVPGGVPDPFSTSFPLFFNRERINIPVYLKWAAILIEKI